MSNYNTTLQSNNTDLQAILDSINELPEAGSVEQATPVISVNSSNGIITATAGTKTSTHQLAFQPAKTITPSTASQIAVSSGYYIGGNITVASVPTQSKTVTPTSSAQSITPDSGNFLSKVTVNAIPSAYVKPSYTKAATTYTPKTTNQIISAGTYLTGVQTIKGDSNLVSGNIKSGVSIFGVNGNYEGNSGVSSEWSENEDAIIGGSIASYTNDRITRIHDYTFYNRDALKSVNFPACITIGSYAFYSCRRLTTASFPACTSIGNSAFYSCYTLTTVSFPVCTSIGSYAFYHCNSLTSVSLPVCTYIGYDAFSGCDNLTTVNSPNCTYIGGYAFFICSKLTTVNFPACTGIGEWAFADCDNLTSVNFPACTTIGGHAFDYCSKLTTVSFSACTSIGPYAFGGCSVLTSVSFPVCTTIGSNAFYNCTTLTTVSFPACTTIWENAFSGCTGITEVNLPVCEKIYRNAFCGCYNISAIYLMASNICSLSHSNAFASTPFNGYSSFFSGTPYIYVPDYLLSMYKTMTNWVYFSSYFSGIQVSVDNNIIRFIYEDFWGDSYMCNAEKDMTWGEFINSSYNNVGFTIVDDIYIECDYEERLTLNSEYVTINDVIIADETYNCGM